VADAWCDAKSTRRQNPTTDRSLAQNEGRRRFRDVVLLGRRNECDVVDQLIDGVSAGEGRSLVIHGEAGIGKTALLEYAAEKAASFRVERASGVEGEMDLAFAGLHQLCTQMLDRLDRLPEPQRTAVETAFGLSGGSPPDRFLVGLATLTLLSEVADERPLLCLVDDTQWIDRPSVQALTFAARRLVAEPVGLLFAARDTDEEHEFGGLRELVVRGLYHDDAEALLTSAVTGPVDESVRERIVAETRGNPLALLELPRGLTTAQLAGGFGLPESGSLSDPIEQSYRRRIEALPPETRRLMLVAAAEPVGDPALVRSAAQQLGIPRDAAEAAAEAGLLEVEALVRFRHPLVRSASYWSATHDERRAVHQALADATDAEADPDREAWHRGQAVVDPDEDVAAALARTADRAQGRGGFAAGAAFLDRAARLTPAPDLRVDRALAAAEAKLSAGATQDALELLALAAAGKLDQLQRARMERLRARIAFVQRRAADAPPLLLRAARRLEPLDRELAVATYREALAAALSAGARDAVVETAGALLAMPRSEPPPAAELLITGQAVRITDGDAAGLRVLKSALGAFRSEQMAIEDELLAYPFACLVPSLLWDEEGWYALSSRYVRLARATGALAALPVALEFHAAIQIYKGVFSTAESLLAEEDALAQGTGIVAGSDVALLLAAWKEPPSQALERILAAVDDAKTRGEESSASYGEYAAALLYNGIRQPELALAAVERANRHHPHGGYGLAQPELIEAASRTGDREAAEATLEMLGERTQAGATDWGLGVEARSRALLADGERAESLYRTAIERLERTTIRTDFARAELLYGEWLRRQGRRVEAREHLRSAYATFSEIGASIFVDRAADELLATGERARRRTDDTRSDLTPQETHIARLAREGLSNPEIGARLFISPKTVEYHLHKVFTKLAISSRRQLEQVLPSEARAAQPV
jgi:DNA-binding CsgD family transcriptional regulator